MPNKNAERGRATRAQLLDVATRLFAVQGYEDTSIETVLREAGVSRGSLYHHFPSKDALFYAVLERIEQEVGEALAEATENVTTAAESLQAGAVAWIQLAADPTIQRIMLIDAPAVLGWERWRQFDEDHVLGTIKLAMTAVAAEGAFPAEHADVFAHVFLAAVNEVTLLIARSEDPASAIASGRAAVEEFVRRLLGSAGPRQP